MLNAVKNKYRSVDVLGKQEEHQLNVKKQLGELKEILLKQIKDFQILQTQMYIVGLIIHQLVLQEVESLKKTTTMRVGSQ